MEIQNFFESLSQQEIEKINQKQRNQNEKEYSNFLSQLKKNKCYICQLELNDFNKDEPCLHWLLRPDGVNKKHIQELFNTEVGLFRTATYVRWLANSKESFQNINDIEQEKSKDKKFELTVKYKNFEWSFTCSPGDYFGHEGSKYGNKPHFHFQMLIDTQTFIRFGDFHPALSKPDIFALEASSLYPDRVVLFGHEAAGMQSLMNNIDADTLFEELELAHDENTAPFHMSTMLEAKEGQSFKSEDIMRLIEESRETGIPFARLAREKLDSNIRTIISPGDGVPNLNKRTKRNRSKKNNFKSI